METLAFQHTHDSTELIPEPAHPSVISMNPMVSTRATVPRLIAVIAAIAFASPMSHALSLGFRGRSACANDMPRSYERGMTAMPAARRGREGSAPISAAVDEGGEALAAGARHACIEGGHQHLAGGPLETGEGRRELVRGLGVELGLPITRSEAGFEFDHPTFEGALADLIGRRAA